MARRIKVQSAKAKGRRLQQWVAQQISDLIGIEWGPDKSIESRPMGQSGTDIRLDKEALEKFPFSIECKWQETWSVPAWIEQAKKNKIEHTDWLLFIKRRRTKPIVILDAELFFDILDKAGYGK